MFLLANNNRKICFRLAWRTIRTNKIRSAFLIFSIALTALLYTVVFYTAESVENSYLLEDQQEYGSTSHIVFDNLTEHQAGQIQNHESVESSAVLHTVGMLSDDMLEYRQIRLAISNPDYARTVEDMPDVGRMPEKAGEVAVDTMTLDSLGIPHVIGTKVALKWQPFSGGAEKTEEFTLCGYWTRENVYTETCAWISSKDARRLEGGAEGKERITLGVNLYQPENLEEQAEKILKDLGLGKVSYTTNLSYNSAQMEEADDQAAQYLGVGVFVVIGGFLLVCNIMLVSRRERAGLFAIMKALGMTPRQTGIYISSYVLILCAMAVPWGVAIGFFVFYHIAPEVVNVMTGIRLELQMLSVYPLIMAIVFSILTAWAGCFFADRNIQRWMPRQILDFLNRERSIRKRKPKKKVTAFGMALCSLQTRKASLAAAALSLFIGALVLGASYIRYISYDEDYYLEEMFISDYSFVDASSVGDFQRYNEKAGNISPEIAEEIRNHPAVEGYGEFLTHEVDLQADADLQKLVTDFYNGISSIDGKSTRKEIMAGQPEWLAGLEKLENTGEYRSVLIGAEGISYDDILFYEPLSGSFDAEKFASGDYVLSVGAASTEGVSSADAGDQVTIQGKTFTVMAALQEWAGIPLGRNSRESAFCLNYVMPADTLRELYPDTNIRQIVTEINPEKEAEFEKFASDIEKEGGIVVQRRSEEANEFWQSAVSAIAVQLFIGLLLFAISMIGFLNVVLSKILTRSREFALYQSLGMTKTQIRKMVFYEGLLHAGICLAATLPVAGAVLWYSMRWYYESDWAYTRNIDWAVTYTYSSTPLILVAVIVLVIAAVAPQICLWKTERKSMVERMRYKE